MQETSVLQAVLADLAPAPSSKGALTTYEMEQSVLTHSALAQYTGDSNEDQQQQAQLLFKSPAQVAATNPAAKRQPLLTAPKDNELNKVAASVAENSNSSDRPDGKARTRSPEEMAEMQQDMARGDYRVVPAAEADNRVKRVKVNDAVTRVSACDMEENFGESTKPAWREGYIDEDEVAEIEATLRSARTRGDSDQPSIWPAKTQDPTAVPDLVCYSRIYELALAMVSGKGNDTAMRHEFNKYLHERNAVPAKTPIEKLNRAGFFIRSKSTRAYYTMVAVLGICFALILVLTAKGSVLLIRKIKNGVLEIKKKVNPPAQAPVSSAMAVGVGPPPTPTPTSANVSGASPTSPAIPSMMPSSTTSSSAKREGIFKRGLKRVRSAILGGEGGEEAAE